LPPLEPRAFVINPPPEPADAASIARGEPLFDQYCSACHGEHAVGGGVVSDLRGSNFLAIDFFYNIVLDGALKDAGMASFKSALSRDDVTEVVQCQYHGTTLPLFVELFTVLCAMCTRDQAWHLQS